MALARSRRRGRTRPVILLLVLTSITFITLDARGWGPIRTARRDAGDLLAPVTRAASKVFHPVENAWNGVFRYGSLKSENDRLRQQINDLKGKEANSVVAQAELARLLALLKVPWASTLPAVTAQVVALPPSNFEQSVQIDKGSADGIVVGFPVVDGAGLVGRIASVGRHRAVVRLLSDPDFSAGVNLPAVPDIGIVNGHGRDKPLTVDLVDASDTMTKGALVVTSGVPKSMFPALIPVGTVTDFHKAPGDLQLSVQVAPAADLDHLSFLKVIEWTPQP